MAKHIVVTVRVVEVEGASEIPVRRINTFIRSLAVTLRDIYRHHHVRGIVLTRA